MSLFKGNVPLKSYTELHKTLVQEVVKREQHRLNYEKLKALNTKLQLELVHKHNTDREENLQGCFDRKAIGNGIEFMLPNPHPPSQVPEVLIDKTLLCTPPPSLSPEDPKKSLLDQELEGLETLLRNTLSKQNPLEHPKSGVFWESSEMISALGQWKRDYSALYEEYQEYQSMVQATVESEIAAAHEKVTLVEQENGRIRSQLEKEKFDLDSTCRELIREKSSLRCEIRTLREELDETRVKLEEKTAQYENLSRKMDETSFSRPKGECQDRAHVALDCRLRAAESRNEFLQNEIQGLMEGKGGLHHEIVEMTQRHDNKVEQLTKHIQNLEKIFFQERKDFEVKYNELKSVIENQQGYITSMEDSIRSNENENEELMAGIQAQMKHMMSEAIMTIASLEEDKSATNNSHIKIAGELKEVRSKFENLQTEIKCHQEHSVNLCYQALAILNATPVNQADFTSIAEDGKLQEEGALKKLLNAVIHTQDQFRKQRDRLQSRIQELENNLKSDKLQHITEVAESIKTCKMYAHVIRKLRKRLDQPKSVAAPKTTADVTEARQPKSFGPNLIGHGDCLKPSGPHKNREIMDKKRNDDLVYLREKHSYFENLLKKLDTSHSSRL